MMNQKDLFAEKGIWLKHAFVSFENIKLGKFPEAITADEYQALSFYNEWLIGKNEFTIHTSGSTGLPKAIRITREQMIQSAWLTAQALGLQAHDKALVSLNTRYIGGLMMLVRSIVLNLQVIVVSPSLLPLQELSPDIHFDFLSFVPMQIQAMMEQMPESLPVLNKAKAILLGGAPVNPALENTLQVIHAPVYHTYGMTETLSHIALKRLNGGQKKEYYTTLPGIHISTDERNCLIIQTPYFGAEPVITNDRVQLLSENTFVWIGRIDNVINTGGVKVQAEQVEKAIATVLAEMQLSYRFFVSALPDSRLGETVTLFLETVSLTLTQELNLLQKAAFYTSRYEKPTSVIYIPSFTETPTGKIDKLRTVQKHLQA